MKTAPIYGRGEGNEDGTDWPAQDLGNQPSTRRAALVLLPASGSAPAPWNLALQIPPCAVLTVALAPDAAGSEGPGQRRHKQEDEERI